MLCIFLQKQSHYFSNDPRSSEKNKLEGNRCTNVQTPVIVSERTHHAVHYQYLKVVF